MKTFFIDSRLKTITEIDTDGTFESFYKLVNCELLEAVSVPLSGDDILYVDEEGKLKENERSTYFWIKGAGNLIGNGIIIGTDLEEGEATDAVSDLEYIKSIIRFVLTPIKK